MTPVWIAVLSAATGGVAGLAAGVVLGLTLARRNTAAADYGQHSNAAAALPVHDVIARATAPWRPTPLPSTPIIRYGDETRWPTVTFVQRNQHGRTRVQHVVDAPTQPLHLTHTGRCAPPPERRPS